MVMDNLKKSVPNSKFSTDLPPFGGLDYLKVDNVLQKCMYNFFKLKTFGRIIGW